VAVTNVRLAHYIVHTAQVARDELANDPHAERCIYLSPRTLPIPGRVIPSTIFAICDRQRLIAARVQVMHEERLRAVVQEAVRPEMELAHTQLFGDEPPLQSDEDFVRRVSIAIQEGYIQAYAFLRAPAGSA
jgi:hypothetical protein